MSDKMHVKKAAGVVGALTLVSRLLGFVRDVCIAWFFGAGFLSDAFFVAFRIPDFFRRLFVEGTLSAPFVSVFTEIMVKKNRADAFEFAGSAFRLISVVLVLAVLAMMAASPAIVALMAPGFLASVEKLSLTAMLMRIMFPYVFFVGMVAICMGFLNVLGHFAAPALAPVLLNIAMIGSMLWISPHMDEPITGLALGVVVGGVLQLALQVPFLIKKGISPFRRMAFYHPGIKKAGMSMLPMIFGAAVYQVNVFVGTFLASFLPEGGVSYLYYADRVVQFPLGIFAVAVSTAILPVLSRQAMTGDRAAVCETFSYALRMVAFIVLPSMAGLIVLRHPIVDLLYQRGQFDAVAARFTAEALMYYGMGIWAFSGVRIVVSAFHAVEDTGTPARTAVLTILINIVFGIILMMPMGPNGVALATSLASMVHFGLLFRHVRRKIGPVAMGPIMISVGKTVFCTLMMVIVVHVISTKIILPETGSWLRLAWGVPVCIAAGVAAYGTCSRLVRHPEFKMIFKRR